MVASQRCISKHDPVRRLTSIVKGRGLTWTDRELQVLRGVYSGGRPREVIKVLPNRTWLAIRGKAEELGLKRLAKLPLSATLTRDGDVGFSAGMIIADGSIMESYVSSGERRAAIEGGAARRKRYYSLPCVQVSMEDKESLIRIAGLWGVGVRFAQKSSVGNDVWRVAVQGKRALRLLRMILPYLAGKKKARAEYLLSKYKNSTTLPLVNHKRFRPFSGMK